MSLIRLDEISIEFGDTPLLQNASLAIEENERICLVGRNGAGKTTLFKIIADKLAPDHGEIHRREHLRISQLEQTLPAASQRKVFDIVLDGLADQRQLIDSYREYSACENPSKQQIQTIESLQTTIEAGGGWNIEQQAEIMKSFYQQSVYGEEPKETYQEALKEMKLGLL